MSIEDIKVCICNFKCFGSQPQGFEKILPINLIIGRNNSGKSTLLDLIDFVTSPKDLQSLSHRGKNPKVVVSDVLTEAELKRVFPSKTLHGPISGDHWVYGRRWIGQRITWEIRTIGSGFDFVSIDPPFQKSLPEHEKSLAKIKGNPFSEFIFKRLLADRDIIPEEDSDLMNIQPNGQGTTNAIQRYINKANLSSSLVEEVLLQDLNSIFEPDGSFTDILVQQLDSGKWEIFLEESEKGRVPLSHTGSGVKTILLVLTFLHLIPHIENKQLGRFMFGFEELENNLHPALQRRLLTYLRKTAVEKKCSFFLTTHSNVAIDLFGNDKKAQIIHVIHDGKSASAKCAVTYIENRGILDDLDIRASDLLQANGIVWLEGPSDRLYFNRWIELRSDGQIREGTHYQCVFYGGRLLAHLSANDPNINPDDVVKILWVNRNAIIIIDSDMQGADHSINETKKRIASEVKQFGGLAWFTAGKEIENYIPCQAIASFYKDYNVPSIGQFQGLPDYLESIEENEGKRFKKNKVLFAERICPYINSEGMMITLDLNDQLTDVCERIRKWNGIKNV